LSPAETYERLSESRLIYCGRWGLAGLSDLFVE
jgi:hypothetical protein